ncbi:MAG: histidine kinase [Holophagaceae bacterium]|nr:histidine kinase [Holophagaceae bacterium]
MGLLLPRQARLEHEQEDMREQVVRHRCATCRGQMNPHVLFNALNSLAELLQQDPKQADLCLRAMASLLRRILDASEVHSHPLGEERALVEDYLAVESVRHGRRPQIEWAWDRLAGRPARAALLIQPLVENALKHGIARNRRGVAAAPAGGLAGGPAPPPPGGERRPRPCRPAAPARSIGPGRTSGPAGPGLRRCGQPRGPAPRRLDDGRPRSPRPHPAGTP